MLKINYFVSKKSSRLIWLLLVPAIFAFGCGGSSVTGNTGVSPAASYITNFSLVADATNVFSTASIVVGKNGSFE